MVSKKCIGLIMGVFAVVVVCIILSLNSMAKPDGNDNPPNQSPGCDNCHETEVDNSEEDAEHLNIEVFQAENEKAVNVIFYSNNSSAAEEPFAAEKMQYEWNEDTEKWDIPILVGAELTEHKKSDEAHVYDAKVENGPDLTLTAPEGGWYYVRGGYYNRSSGVKAWTVVEIFIDYANRRPSVRALFDELDSGELVSSDEYGKPGTSSDDYPDKTATFLFDEDGLVKLNFIPEGTDPDDEEGNLTYFWDYNDLIDDNDNGINTDDNDTSQETPIQQLYTFYQANHYENKWEEKVDRPGQIFEPNVPYVINLSVTDNHKNRAWNWANLNIMFYAPKTYPDLQIMDARFKEIDDDEDGAFEIGEQMTIEIDIENTGINATDGTPFKLKFEDQDGKKMIPDYEYEGTLEAQTKKTITYLWTGTTLWADSVTTPVVDLEYNVTITIDYENKIDEGPEYAETNNTYTKLNATYFQGDIGKEEPDLKIDKITLNNTDYSGGVFDWFEDYPLNINITIKNEGEGNAEHYTLFIYLMSTDVKTQKERLKSFSRDDLAIGESITIEATISPSLTDDGTQDNHTLKIVVEYKADDEMDSKTVKLLVKEEPPDEIIDPVDPDTNGTIDNIRIPIIAIVAIIAVVVILVMVRSRSYEDEDEEDDEYEDEDEDEEEDEEEYKSKAKKYKSKAKK